MPDLGITLAGLSVARARLEFARREQHNFVSSMTLYIGGGSGLWSVTHMDAMRGAGQALANRVTVVEVPGGPQAAGAWCLRGLGSNHRYATRAELDVLGARQAGRCPPPASLPRPRRAV